jgi:methionyl-tRNA formyltransferase
MICIAGKNQIALDALAYLLETQPRETLCVVLNRTDNGVNSWQPSLKFYAEQQQIPIVTLEDIYGQKDLLFLSLEFDRIIRPERFASKQLYNIHFSLLPQYKGMFTSILPIVHGEQQSGVTLHRIDRGIDTGEIIDQLAFDIAPTDNGRDLYQHYLNHAFLLFKKNIAQLLTGKVQSRPQPIEGASYYSKNAIDFTKLAIDYYKTAYEVHNQIRAFCFRDYQLPTFEGQPIYKSSYTNTPSPAKPKTVVAETAAYYEVTTIDYNLRLYKDYYAALWEACNQNDQAAVASYLPFVPDINLRNHNGWNALTMATYNGHLELVRYLVEQGADINATNYKGTSVLMYAKSATVNAGQKNMELLETILNLGGNLEHCDERQKNVLEYARENGEWAVLEFLEKKRL